MSDKKVIGRIMLKDLDMGFLDPVNKIFLTKLNNFICVWQFYVYNLMSVKNTMLE
jgi:hypothetical protein